MLKKYLIPGLLLAGCAVAFIICSLLVFVTKGKSPGLLKQKLLLGVLLISLSGALASCQLDVPALTQAMIPAKIKSPLCYVVAPPPIEFTAAKPIEDPTTLCYVVIQPPILAKNQAAPAIIPTCYFAVAAADRTEQAKTAFTPPLCYAPARLG